jgi:hypothetical protein
MTMETGPDGRQVRVQLGRTSGPRSGSCCPIYGPRNRSGKTLDKLSILTISRIVLTFDSFNKKVIELSFLLET